ncbi:MAG TPA: AAA domain-containing protein, partial [Haliangium sp.]|nr:AAA domain-containing protein [Haliangium sp.]
MAAARIHAPASPLAPAPAAWLSCCAFMASPADTEIEARIDAWLARLADLWRRERRAHEQRFAEDIQARSLTERIEAGVSLRRLTIEEIDATAGGRLMLWLVARKPGDLLQFRLQPGDPVRLLAETPEAQRSDAASVRATLARRQDTRIAVILDDELPEALNNELEDGDAELQLDPDSPRATFDRGDAAIARFRGLARTDDRLALRDVLLGRRPPALQTMPADHPSLRPAPAPFDTQLNQPQRDAVAAALAAPDIALIHGPPGTGKTRTLVEVIGQMVARGQRVLATAASNTAVDNLAE